MTLPSTSHPDMRGFLTLEILLAFSIAVITITGVASLAFGIPEMLANVRLAYQANVIATNLLTGIEKEPRPWLAGADTIASTTEPFVYRLQRTDLAEGAAARFTTSIAWQDIRGRAASTSMDALVVDASGSSDSVCYPFVLGDWRHPQIISYALTSAGLIPGLLGHYPVADVSASRDRLEVAISQTDVPGDPTLLSFALAPGLGPPRFVGKFDNASTSRVGYSALAVGNGALYAANAFGSASAPVCASGACSQLDTFDISPELRLVSRLSLARTEPPYAQSAGGGTTPAKSVAYRNGTIYLGLEKTIAGNEFDVIDVRTPDKPRYLGGLPVGRSVNAIATGRDRAALATSDSSRELILADIADPTHPHITNVWDAAGSAGFGLGSATASQFPLLYFGRSYVNNAPELYVFLRTSDAPPAPALSQDLGTAAKPESVRGVLLRDFLAFILTDHRLLIRDTGHDLSEPFAPDILFAGTAARMSCRGNVLYIGSINNSGDGVLTLVTSS